MRSGTDGRQERAAGGVIPTARWFFRGVWKFVLTVALTLAAMWVVGLIVRLVVGTDSGGSIYP